MNNFESQPSIDSLLGQLLAFIVMFQKKIEFYKCKLAGNQAFHTRIAFQKLDHRFQNQISPQDILLSLSANSIESQKNCDAFIRKYSSKGYLTYDEFLKIISPKTNKTLTQRLLIRTLNKNSTLEDYLQKTMLQMFDLYVKMSGVTQDLRRSIQKSEELTHLELSSAANVYQFLQICSTSNDETYDISLEDIKYLSHHIRSANQISEFTDADIKEIICPLDMTSQRNNIVTKKIYEEPLPLSVNKTMNFLGKTYQKVYPDAAFNKKQSFQEDLLNQDRPKQSERRQHQHHIVQTYRTTNSNADAAYNGLYIDNFLRGSEADQNSRMEINKYFTKKLPVEKFQDDLGSNQSSISKKSKGSAFEQY